MLSSLSIQELDLGQTDDGNYVEISREKVLESEFPDVNKSGSESVIYTSAIDLTQYSKNKGKENKRNTLRGLFSSQKKKLDAADYSQLVMGAVSSPNLQRSLSVRSKACASIQLSESNDGLASINEETNLFDESVKSSPELVVTLSKTNLRHHDTKEKWATFMRRGKAIIVNSARSLVGTPSHEHSWAHRSHPHKAFQQEPRLPSQE